MFIDPLDCTADPCHLAWIMRDDWDLLRLVPNARCSNGSLISELQWPEFESCPKV